MLMLIPSSTLQKKPFTQQAALFGYTPRYSKVAGTGSKALASYVFHIKMFAMINAHLSNS
jgi:hypothetical protein